MLGQCSSKQNLNTSHCQPGGSLIYTLGRAQTWIRDKIFYWALYNLWKVRIFASSRSLHFSTSLITPQTEQMKAEKLEFKHLRRLSSLLIILILKVSHVQSIYGHITNCCVCICFRCIYSVHFHGAMSTSTKVCRISTGTKTLLFSDDYFDLAVRPEWTQCHTWVLYFASLVFWT